MNINKTHILFFLIGLNISLIYLYINTTNTVLIKTELISKECHKFF